MRTLHVLNELRFSGAEVLLTSGAAWLDATTSSVLSTGERIGAYAPELKQAGFEVYHLPFTKSFLFFVNYYRLVREIAPDVVHVHCERASFWYTMIAVLCRRKCVRTIHNEFSFIGRLRLQRALERQVTAWSGVVHVACSRRVATNEYERFRVHPIVIDNWIDPLRLPPRCPEGKADARRSLSIPEHAFVTLSVGNEAPAKNLRTLFATCARFPSSVQHIHCGDVSNELRTLVNEGQNSDNIHLAGAVRNISDYLAAADVFLSVSYNEGAQISLLEAAASGLICITTRAGIAEAFDGQEGVYFVTPDGSAVSETLLQVQELTPVERYRQGACLANYTKARFSPENGAAKYQALYKELIAGGGPTDATRAIQSGQT